MSKFSRESSSSKPQTIQILKTNKSLSCCRWELPGCASKNHLKAMYHSHYLSNFNQNFLYIDKLRFFVCLFFLWTKLQYSGSQIFTVVKPYRLTSFAAVPAHCTVRIVIQLHRARVRQTAMGQSQVAFQQVANQIIQNKKHTHTKKKGHFLC